MIHSYWFREKLHNYFAIPWIDGYMDVSKTVLLTWSTIPNATTTMRRNLSTDNISLRNPYSMLSIVEINDDHILLLPRPDTVVYTSDSLSVLA